MKHSNGIQESETVAMTDSDHVHIRVKATKRLLTDFIIASSSRYNEYPKKFCVETIFSVLNGTNERKDLYRDFKFEFGQYTESKKTSCRMSGGRYFFNYSERSLKRFDCEGADDIVYFI